MLAAPRDTVLSLCRLLTTVDSWPCPCPEDWLVFHTLPPRSAVTLFQLPIPSSKPAASPIFFPPCRLLCKERTE
ncbi:hypothetical protein L596_016849 [Steinernema carpocapsae]|uniref:Uncharacterized protein n=1 Tax=Steinernema carpocapsae TaxID=34508 RepID=A0A4V6A3I4_STECR|nr:hypothetical protein L596_016849 [Steinernema carpocapsae]